jgi:8-oxo-dGTP pyrophosphatase MutT (NUDIX family)
MLTLDKKAAGLGVQYAALPYRRVEQVEILLVTSRDTGRWVIPKGWPMKGRKPFAAAAQEAFEEAGVEGRVAKQEIGFYRYPKQLADGAVRQCTVHVYPLKVERQKKKWREKGQRTCQWFTLEEAAHAVQERELQDLIHLLGISLGSEPSCETGQMIALSFAQAADFLGED